MTEPKDKLPSLEELQRKIDAATPESMKDQPPDSSAASHGRAMQWATELLAGVGVGGVLGFFIDRALGTMPWFFIIFFFLGFAAGLRTMLRSFNKGE